MKRNTVLGAVGLALWLAVIFAALPAYGILPWVPLEELANGSSHIVIGRVVDLVPRWVPGAVYERMYPNQQCTDVIVSIERCLKGSAEDTLTVRVRYGVVEVPPEGITLPDGQVCKPGASITLPNGETMEIPEEHELGGPLRLGEDWGTCDNPCFRKGEYLLLFLQQNTEEWRDKYIQDQQIEAPYVPIYEFLYQPGTCRVVLATAGKCEIENDKVIGVLDFPEEAPLQEVINRIEELIRTTGTEKTSWGEIKNMFLQSASANDRFAC